MIKLFFFLIVLGLTWIYRPSFVSPFFQDDALLLQHATPQYFLTPVPQFHYHPVANQFFYFLSKNMFGTNVIGYHFVLFLASILGLVFIFKLTKILLSSQRKALLTTFFYAFNVSLFANFYWIAVSYFVLGGFFFFASACLFFKKGTVRAFLTVLSFVLSVGSNELGIFLCSIFIGLAWYKNYWPKRLWALVGLDAIFLVLKVFWIGFSTETDYSLRFGLSTLATIRWYLLRALNLPEGINRNQDVFLVSFFVIMVGLLIYSLIHYIRSKKINGRLFLLAVFWFIAGALPFYFLPNHMSSYYLTVALFGPALIFGEILDNKKVTVLVMVLYFLITLRGLDFLSKTHWIILKNTGPIGSF